MSTSPSSVHVPGDDAVPEEDAIPRGWRSLAGETNPPGLTGLAPTGGQAESTGWTPNAGPVAPSRELDQLHRAYAATRDRGVRDRLLEAYDDFALALARRFPSRREAPEDLAQVARMGLLHAVERFEPQRDRPFTSFARATITGELKRHIRDRTWVMRVPRSLQEHFLVVAHSVDELTQELGRSPRIPEVAAHAGLSDEQVLEAMELGGRHRPASLDVAPGEGRGRPLEPPAEGQPQDQVEIQAVVGALLARLTERERRILHLRFAEGLSQSEIATRIGVSQMYISRLLARTLARMRVLAAGM